MMKYFSGPVWLHCLISYPADAPRYLGTWLDLATSHRQTWLFSCTSMYHSTDLLTVRGVAHLVVHGTSGSTSYETIPHVQLEISGDVLSTADMVVQRRDGPRRLREIDWLIDWSFTACMPLLMAAMLETLNKLYSSIVRERELWSLWFTCYMWRDNERPFFSFAS